MKKGINAPGVSGKKRAGIEVAVKAVEERDKT